MGSLPDDCRCLEKLTPQRKIRKGKRAVLNFSALKVWLGSLHRQGRIRTDWPFVAGSCNAHAAPHRPVFPNAPSCRFGSFDPLIPGSPQRGCESKWRTKPNHQRSRCLKRGRDIVPRTASPMSTEQGIADRAERTDRKDAVPPFRNIVLQFYSHPKDGNWRKRRNWITFSLPSRRP